VFGIKKKSQSFLGIDISCNAVKIIELSKTSEGYSVESYSKEALPPEVVVANEIKSTEKLGDAIIKAMSKTRTKTREAAVSVSGSSVITKIIEMPAGLKDHEMEDQIVMEADQYIPFPLDEVAIDFFELGPATRENHVDILLVACRQDVINDKVLALNMGGITPKVVDVESFVLARAMTLIEHQIPVREDGNPALVAFVDVGNSITKITILSDGETLHYKDLDIGGKELINAIMLQFQMNEKEAEIALKEGTLPVEYSEQILPMYLENLASTINREIQMFFSATEYDDVDVVVMAGGGSKIEGIVDKIQEQTNINTELARPLEKMTFARSVNEHLIENDEPSLMIACGLAMRSFT